ncbi:MAG: precorrin-2 C(20)-methyltransferase [Burkholderiales bacterium]
MNLGKLIGVSLGPGDPGLMTRKAWDALSRPAHWTYPVAKSDAGSYALDIVVRAGITPPLDAVPLLFPMTHHPEVLAKSWARASSTVLERLRSGQDVIFLVEGDASTYSTFGHLARTVRELDPQVEVEVIPGVSSYCAAAARVGTPLAEADDTLAVIPAGYGVAVIDHMLDEFDSLVLLKVKPLLDEVIALLERRGLIGHACFIEKVGTPDERVVRDVARLKGETVAYLSLLLVHNPNRPRGEIRRGCRKKKTAAANEELA